MHLVDSSANSSRWRERPIEVMVFSVGMLLLALLLPPVPCALAIIVVSLFSIVLGAAVPLGVYLRVMVVPLAFLAAGSVALLFSVSIDEGLLCVVITPEGVQTAGTVVLRSLAAVSSMMALALTVPVGEILSLLRRWHVPAVLTELMGLIYRLLFVFDRTLHDTIRAQGCRLGYRNLRTSYRSLGAALAALFIRSIDRARRLEMGLAARGYQGELRVLCCRHPVSVRAIVGILLTHLGIAALGLLSPLLGQYGGFPWPI